MSKKESAVWTLKPQKTENIAGFYFAPVAAEIPIRGPVLQLTMSSSLVSLTVEGLEFPQTTE